MINWIRKIFGYKYKILIIEIDYKNSEFDGIAIAKLPIDYNYSAGQFKRDVDAQVPIFSYLKDNMTTIYSKSSVGNLKLKFFRDFEVERSGGSIKCFHNYFSNLK